MTEAETVTDPDLYPPDLKPEKKKHNFKRAGREMAMQFLYQFDLGNNSYDDRELTLFWKKIESVDPELLGSGYRKSRKYAERIIAGVIENLEEIDGKLARFSEKWNLNRMGAVDRNILRVGAFEMLYCDDIPPIVSINEAVEISKDFATDKSGAFINGVLNGLKDSLNRPVKERE